MPPTHRLLPLLLTALLLAIGCRSTHPPTANTGQQSHAPATESTHDLADAAVDGPRDWWQLTDDQRGELLRDLQHRRNSPAEPMGLFTLRSPAGYRRVLLERVRVDNPDAPRYHIAYYLSQPCDTADAARAARLDAHGAAPLAITIAPRPSEHETLLFLGVWPKQTYGYDHLVALVQSPKYIRATEMTVVADVLVPVSKTVYFYDTELYAEYAAYLAYGGETNAELQDTHQSLWSGADAETLRADFQRRSRAPQEDISHRGTPAFHHIHEGEHYRFPYWKYLERDGSISPTVAYEDIGLRAFRYWLICEFNSDTPALARSELIRLHDMLRPSGDHEAPLPEVMTIDQAIAANRARHGD